MISNFSHLLVRLESWREGRREKTLFPLQIAELTEPEELCKYVPTPVKFRKKEIKTSLAGFLLVLLPSHLAAFPWGKDAGGDSLPRVRIPGRQKFGGLPGLKAVAESAVQLMVVRGKEAFSAGTGDSKCSVPLKLGQNQTEISKSLKAQNYISLHRFLVLDKSLIKLIRDF